MMRKVAIITGNRAEYGLLRNVIKQAQSCDSIELFLMVTGAHLSVSHGFSISEIESDGFPISARIPIFEDGDQVNITQIMSNTLAGFGRAFNKIQPDIAIFLGDRYESFAAASAAVATHIPIAHCHGGEISEGSVDNQWRHAMTKLANIHFCATEEFRNRIIQMGEEPEKVFNVGALGIENIKQIPLLSKEELEASLAFSFGEKNAIVTFHAETAYSHEKIAHHTRNLLNSLLTFTDLGVILTYPNPDLGHEIIIKELIRFNQQYPDKSVLIRSLGSQKYLSVLNVVDLVIGNSSSGLIEAPSFHIPTINIGNRQQGRLAPKSVINCGYNTGDITSAIQKGLSLEFAQHIADLQNPYDGGPSAKKIVDVIASISLQNIIFKSFKDLDFHA